MSFATSPDSGHSGPHTPPRGQVPPVKPTKSSPVGKVYKYFLPENREQYQKFGHDERFMLKPFDESGFLDFLKLKDQLPEIVLGENLRKQESFIELANTAAQIIKDEYFSQGNTLEFRDTGNRSPPGHVTDTKCNPDITAAFQNNWKDDVLDPTSTSPKACFRPKKGLTFFFGIGGEGIREFHVQWDHERFDQLLYSSYINIEFDKETTAKYTINIRISEREKRAVSGFYPIYARNPFATRTHVLSHPRFKLGDKNLSILKDQLCRVGRRFEELKILQEHVHKPTQVPGVVVATYGETIPIGEPLSKERWKHRLGLGESGSPFTSIPTLSQVLETLFDVLEVLRYLRLHREVLHRDISSGNVLYVENSSDRSSPPKTVPLPQDLCFAKYLLGESNDPSKTSMLLVDFNLAEHLGPENGDKPRIDRTGTPIFIARAVEWGAPVPPTYARVPGIPQSCSPYATAHPDRVKEFSSLIEKQHFDPDLRCIDDKKVKKSRDEFRHELNHDAESVFWLLLYWAMVVQPKNYDLAAVLVIDSYWLAATDPRREDLYYITEAFQRLILNFIIDNRGKEFMHCRVDKTFRKVQETQDSHALSVSDVQSLDAQSRVIPDTDEIEID
ncbi:hypothetical protein F5148DRAFT_1368682 [Russula earlei]|uniref:Uncharacterized protein n=1 Tax=Russula earlei TaxID=71964 RepID=A0ACC0U717_9AGAM|nr:hypothetical protein F5148DRAFT_1368682 [Russula earlei]